MAIDLDQELVAATGQPILDRGPSGEGVVAVTLRAALFGAAQMPLEGDAKLTLQEKLDLDRVVRRLADQEGPWSPDPEHVVMLRERVNAAYPSPLMVGAICAALAGG